MSKRIIVTGGDGRFAQELKKIKSSYTFIFRNKKDLDILSIKSNNNQEIGPTEHSPQKKSRGRPRKYSNL